MFYYIYSLPYCLRFLYITFNIIFGSFSFIYLFPRTLEYWCLVTVNFRLYKSVYTEKTIKQLDQLFQRRDLKNMHKSLKRLRKIQFESVRF